MARPFKPFTAEAWLAIIGFGAAVCILRLVGQLDSCWKLFPSFAVESSLGPYRSRKDTSALPKLQL